MSDCSSEIMRFPNTFAYYVEEYSFTDSEEIYTNGAKLVPTFRVMDGIRHYHEPLEQRYQQLEQVAKNMQKCLAKHAYDWTQVAEETADHYREQLEALGVSLDD